MIILIIMGLYYTNKIYGIQINDNKLNILIKKIYENEIENKEKENIYKEYKQLNEQNLEIMIYGEIISTLDQKLNYYKDWYTISAKEFDKIFNDIK